MVNINLSDSRKRDAIVSAESVRVAARVQYVGPDGEAAKTRKVLKATSKHDYNSLLEQFKTPEDVGEALIAGDPEIDMETFGVFLWNIARVYTNENDEIVFRVEQTEIVRDPQGNEKSRRPRKQAESNVETDIPLTWTGKIVPKNEAYKQFVFSSKLQIVHVNGLTYDFLFGMAKELDEAGGLLLLGAGKGGKEPLIFRRGATPYRGFLEGRVFGTKYTLLLHLTNLELKALPEVEEKTEEAETKKTEKPAQLEKSVEDKPKKAVAEAKPKKPTTRKKAAPKKKPVAAKLAEKKTIAQTSDENPAKAPSKSKAAPKTKPKTKTAKAKPAETANKSKTAAKPKAKAKTTTTKVKPAPKKAASKSTKTTAKTTRKPATKSSPSTSKSKDKSE